MAKVQKKEMLIESFVDGEQLDTILSGVEEAKTAADFFRVLETQEDYESANETVRSLAILSDEITAIYEPTVKIRHAAWKEATGERKSFLDIVDGAKDRIRRIMSAFVLEEDRKVREASRALEADEIMRREREADILEGEGRHEEAQLLRQSIPSAERVVSDVAKEAGGSVRREYYAEVLDIKALCQAVLDGTVPEIAVTPNQKFLDAQAQSLGDYFKMPGVVRRERVIPITRR